MNLVLLQRQSVFVIGFAVGFIIVFLSKYASRILETPAELQLDSILSLRIHKKSSKTVWNLVENWSKNSKNYETWQSNQNVRTLKLDLDSYIYGAQFDNDYKNRKIILEAEWLKSKVPVTCIVFVEKLKLAATIKDTWGKYCNQVLFFSQHLNDLDLSVINLRIRYTSSWQLLCEVINYIWKRNKKIPLHWVIFVKDDTFVIPENLRYMLAQLDFNEPHYLGHAVVLWGLPYNVAQAGYVLSYESIRRIVKMFDTPDKCAAGGKYWKKEDFYLGKHLASLGIHPSDTRDSEQRGTFHGFSLNTLLWGVAKPGSYYTRALYPPGPECCSNRTITFNVGEADKMRTINYILYQLRIFENGIYGNRLAPTPIPENEVWKSALRDEFNMTDVEEISSEKYFQIWRTKYSEPEHFIARNFKNMPEVLKSMLEAYELQTNLPNKSVLD